jgi:AraC family transcriptional regulator of adaptative response/methylated-DNA-[protein]-cysteine methyltransferase
VCGHFLIAQTRHGICSLSFDLPGRPSSAEKKLRAHWPLAEFVEDPVSTAQTAEKINSIWSGCTEDSLKLSLYGSNFQIQVWQALLKIPSGAFVPYQAIADYLNKPGGARAVGSAIGSNPVAVLIPCHRVLSQSGLVENYAWGSSRKKILLGMESLKTQENPALSKVPVFAE